MGVWVSVATAFDSPVVIDASNKSFTATVDGRTSLTINLPEGSYASGDALASAFQAAINSDSVLASFGVGVTAGWASSAFTFTSKSLGMAYAVTLAWLSATLDRQSTRLKYRHKCAYRIPFSA